MRDAIASHLGDSLAARQRPRRRQLRLVAGVLVSGDRPRHDVYAIASSALPPTLDNVSSVLDAAAARWPPSPAALALYLLGMGLPVGRHPRSIRASTPTARTLLCRIRRVFLSLPAPGLIAGLMYWWLFAYVHPWLFDELFATLTRNMSVERSAFLVRALFYAIFGGVLVATSLVIDYSKVRMRRERQVQRSGRDCVPLRSHPPPLARRHLALCIEHAESWRCLALWACSPREPGAGVHGYGSGSSSFSSTSSRAPAQASVHGL